MNFRKSKSLQVLATSLILFSLSIVSVSVSSQVAMGTIRLGPELAYNESTQEIDGFTSKFKSTSLKKFFNSQKAAYEWLSEKMELPI